MYSRKSQQVTVFQTALVLKSNCLTDGIKTVSADDKLTDSM